MPMSIILTPSTPVIQTQTITNTVNTFTVTNVEFDLAENIVTFTTNNDCIFDVYYTTPATT